MEQAIIIVIKKKQGSGTGPRIFDLGLTFYKPFKQGTLS